MNHKSPKSLLKKLLIILILISGYFGAKAQEEFDFNIFLESIDPVHKDSMASVLYRYGTDFYLNDSLDASKILFQKSLKYSKELMDLNLESRSNVMLGIVYNDLLNFNNSLESYTSALQTSQLLSDTTIMLDAMNGIENYYFQIEVMDSAIAYCTKAIEISKISKDYATLSGKYGSLCSYLAPSDDGVINNSFLIHGLMDSSLIAARKAGDPNILVFALANYGLDYYNRSPEIAIEYLQASIDSARNLPAPSDGLVYALTKSSEAYFRSGQSDYAKTLMDEALQLAYQVNDTRQLTHLHYLFGRYYDKNDLTDLAVRSFKEAIRLAEKHRYSYYLTFIYHNLFQHYHSRNLLDSSFVYQKKYLDVIKKEHDREMSLQIARLSAKFQVEQKIEAIDNLTLISAQRETIIKSQRKFIFSLFFGILVGGILFFLLLIQFRRIRNAHKKLARNAKELTDKNKLIANLKLQRESKLEHVYDDLKERLTELLEKEEIFLQKDLTLAKTALLLNTNTSYLSALINKYYDCKFNQFINKYRVERSCELMANPEMSVYSIEGIAELSGFKSKSVFNLEFKEITGVHPSVYRRSLSDSSGSN